MKTPELCEAHTMADCLLLPQVDLQRFSCLSSWYYQRRIKEHHAQEAHPHPSHLRSLTSWWSGCILECRCMGEMWKAEKSIIKVLERRVARWVFASVQFSHGLRLAQNYPPAPPNLFMPLFMCTLPVRSILFFIHTSRSHLHLIRWRKHFQPLPSGT